MHRGAGVLEGWVALFLLACVGFLLAAFGDFLAGTCAAYGGGGLASRRLIARLREPKAEKVAKSHGDSLYDGLHAVNKAHGNAVLNALASF